MNTILSRCAMQPWIEPGRLVARRCGVDGLDLRWAALSRDDANEAVVIADLADFLTP